LTEQGRGELWQFCGQQMQQPLGIAGVWLKALLRLEFMLFIKTKDTTKRITEKN
jgi:hypothetical protein